MKMSWRKDVRINSEGGSYTARVLTLDQEERLLSDDQRLKRVAKQESMLTERVSTFPSGE